MLKPKIIEWIRYAQLEKRLSFDAGEPEAPLDEIHRDVLIQELVDHKYVICGDAHQSFAIPVFNDGYMLLSMRVWAEIMSEAISLQRKTNTQYLNKDKYDFYMSCLCSLQERWPRTAPAENE